MDECLDIHPISGRIGAEIAGIDLQATVSPRTQEALRQALWRHLVLVFRDQHLDRAQQKRVTEIFGPLQRVPYVRAMADDPDIIAVLKEASEQKVGVFGGDWHSDFSFLPRPPAGSVLSAIEVPPYGGDTLWSNQIAAYASLPRRLRAAVEGRDAIHTGAPYGRRHAPRHSARAGASIEMTRGDPEADREQAHPVGRPHPESGELALFVNPIYTVRLDGEDVEASQPTLDALYRHASRPDFTCRHRWRAGDVVVWDNRATMHYAINDYDGHRRLLHRTTFADRPGAGGTPS